MVKIMYSCGTQNVVLFQKSLRGWINRSHIFTGHLATQRRCLAYEAVASDSDVKFSRSRLTRDSAKKCIRAPMHRGNCIQRTSREFISAKRGWHIGIVLVVWPRLCTLSARQLSISNGIVLLVLSVSPFFFSCLSATSGAYATA